MRWLIPAALVLVLSSPAFGQDAAESEEDERARIHFEAGRSYFRDGAYERAEEEFRRAHALSGYPELLMNIATALERLGRWDEAADYMERYASEAEEVADRPSLERRIENLRRRARGESASGGLDALGTPSEGDDSGTSARTVGAVISFGVAGAGLATFGILGGLALAERGSLEDGCGATSRCEEADVSSLRALSLGADVGLAIAGAGAVAGVLVLLLVSDDGDDGEGVAARVAPWVAEGGAGVLLGGAL